MKDPVLYNYQAFVITAYFGPTNHRAAKIKATNLTSGASVYVSWDDALDQKENHLKAATALYRKLDQQVPARVVFCGTKNNRGYIFTAHE